MHVADLAVAGDTVVSRDLFAFDRACGHVAVTGLQPSFLARLRHAGLTVHSRVRSRPTAA